MSEEEILSQEEMADLASKENVAGAKEELYEVGQVIAYDFKQPEHAKQWHFPTLQIINEKTALDLREKLEFMLQQKVEVNANDVVINKYGEFVNSLNIPIDIKRIHVPQLKGNFLICFDNALINQMIEGYFGAPNDLPSVKNGNNKGSESGDEEKNEDDDIGNEKRSISNEVLEKEEFTNAESRISQKLLNYVLECMRSGWGLIGDYEFKHQQTENNPRLINYLDYDELIINVNFELELRGKKSVIKIGIPYKMLDKVKDQLRRVVQNIKETKDKKWLLKLYEKMQVVPMELVGELSRITLPVNKLIQLKEGDMISFAKPENVTLYVDKTPVLVGHIGESNGQTAIQVSSWIKPNKRDN